MRTVYEINTSTLYLRFNWMHFILEYNSTEHDWSFRTGPAKTQGMRSKKRNSVH